MASSAHQCVRNGIRRLCKDCFSENYTDSDKRCDGCRRRIYELARVQIYGQKPRPVYRYCMSCSREREDETGYCKVCKENQIKRGSCLTCSSGAPEDSSGFCKDCKELRPKIGFCTRCYSFHCVKPTPFCAKCQKSENDQ